MGTTEQIVKNIVATDFDSLDSEAVRRAKWRVLDAVGCLIGGANAPGCPVMVDLVRKWGGVGESTVLVHGVKGPAHNVAMTNSLMTRSYDYEPVEADGEGASSPAHISGTTVPTALTLAERQGASGKDLLTALLLGDDLASRLGVASGFSFDLGWDNTGTINMLGATAIASKLLRLDEKQVLNALGIALNQMAGTMDGVFDKTLTFKLPIALASRNAIFSAELAGQGFSGVKDPLLGDHGFFSLYCRNYNTENLTKNLGKRFYSDRVIKPYSCCRANHSAVDSALKIAGAHDIRPEDVEEIVIYLTPAIRDGFVGQPFYIGETPQVNAAFSITYTVATALLRKEVRPKYFTDEFIRDPKVNMLIDKIRLEPSIPPEKKLTTEIRLKRTDGEVFSAHTDFPTGDFYETPLTDEEIKAKYRDNVAFSQTVSTENAEKALEIAGALEELGDVRELTSLLVRE
ncbi:MAG: MmgE/PrpD family protein [Dehalococcoidia bacterium]